ncbi:AP-3 complex subunit beta, putative [Plasmodium berghei]|uniref:AP-3 complex subunit beta, putative n=1 Tax=Plasmodium berghei TaxID=5821 RepID=A0A1D3S6Q9_PLABE|nr:AP-3 complex subunit beta, putative [Plasmodium berghei]
MEKFGFNIKLPLIEKASTNVKDFISYIKLNDGIYFEKIKFDNNEIISNLENNNVYKKIEAMKHILIAHILKKNVSSFFFNVLTNISVNNLVLKKLIYNYLILYAHGNTDLTLLSTNSFKKDLNNSNYQIRSYALRAITSIKSLTIINLLIGMLKKLSNDDSPNVRKTCADVIPSIYFIDKDQFIFLRKILLKLISDKEITVVSSAIISFSTICIHNHIQLPYIYQVKNKKEFNSNKLISYNDDTCQDSTKFTNLYHNQIYEHVSNQINQTHINHNIMHNTPKVKNGEVKNGEVKNGEVKNGEVKNGEVKNGEIKNGEIKNGEIKMDDTWLTNMPDETQIYNSLSLLHVHYYKLCKYLLYMHPYNQTYLIDLLLRYCRMFYRNPLKNEQIKLKKKEKKIDKNINNDKPFNENNYDTFDEYKNYTIDIEIFIDKLLLLLSSNSYSVVLITISSLYKLTEFTYKEEMIQAILFCLLKSNIEKNDEIYEIFIKSIKPIIKSLKNDFDPYISYFFINNQDSTIKKSLKIDILYILNNQNNQTIILDEFIHTLYIPNNNEFIIKKLFRYITEISLQNSKCMSKFINQIMIMINSNIKIYSYESILSLRKLLQQNDNKQIKKIIFFLIKILLQVQSTDVKISILWILANYQKYIDYLLVYDLSRILVKSFKNSDNTFKIHIIHFLFKIWIYQLGCIIQNNFHQVDLKKKQTQTLHDKNGQNYQNEHAKMKSDFLLFEKLCKSCFLVAYQDRHFDIQDTTKFYYHVMFTINKLKSQNLLNYQLLQTNIFNQPISDLTLSLSYLKSFYLYSGESIIAHSLQLGSNNLFENKLDKYFSQFEQNKYINNKHKKIHIYQLNTISNLLNLKIPLYADLPYFSQFDLPNTEHVNNIEKEKKKPISFSSRDLKYNQNITNNINSHIFSNIDDFYKEENMKFVQNQISKFSDTSFLINKGSNIQGEDEESDNNQQSQKINKFEKYEKVETAKDLIYEEIEDIEKLFFNTNE